jgi:molecular chaperone GrpE (heat shock protein)
MPGEKGDKKNLNDFVIYIQPPERLLRGMDNLSPLLKSVQDLGRRIGDLEGAVLKTQLDPVFRDLLLLGDGIAAAIPHFEKDPAELVERFTSYMNLVQMEIQTILRRYGVETIDSVGQRFDADIHQIAEVVYVDPNTEEDETIVLEIRKPGYLFEGRILRLAEVAVARKPALSAEKAVT